MNSKNTKAYKIGEKYPEFATKSECNAIMFDGNLVQVFILECDPNKSRIDDIRLKEPFFQLFCKNNIVFLLIKFGDLDWVDIPYIHTFDADICPVRDDEAGYPLKIYFVNSKTGEVILKRYCCLSCGLSKAFYYALQEQKKHLPKNVSEKINSIRASFHPNEIARLSLGK